MLEASSPRLYNSTNLGLAIPRQVLNRINDVLNHPNAHGARVTGKPYLTD